jgi:selenocysteine-specific elongation factor
MPVDRAFTIKGTGTVVTGTVWSGRLSRDENVRILPSRHSARVRGIQGHGLQLDVASAGGRTAIALAGVDVADVPRGSTIVTDRDWRPTTFARADVTLVPDLEVEVRPRTWFRFHVGTAEVGARVVARTIDSSRPFAARLVLDEPVVLRAGDRFVLRTSAPLNTIGGGVITDPYAPKRARPWSPGLSARERFTQLLDEAGADGVDAATLPVRLGLSASEVRDLTTVASDEVAVVGARIVARARLTALQAELLAVVTDYHADHPLEPGISTQLLRSQLRGTVEIVDAALQAEVVAQRIASSGGAIFLAGWAPKLDSDGSALSASILARLNAAGAEPPSVEELAGELGQDPGPVLRFLERRGDVVQVEQTRYYAADSLKLVIDRLRTAMSGGAEVGPSELREKLALSRKFLIPLLEYCDRVGYTKRNSAGRVWHGT